MRSHLLRLLFAASLLFTAPAALRAQAADAGPAQRLNQAYSFTKTGWGNASRVTNPGSVYVVHVDGLLAQPIASHITPTNTVVDGKLLPPAKGFKAAFGAMGNAEQIQPGQRFYLTALDDEDGALVFRLISLDTRVTVNNDVSSRSRLRLYLRFPMAKDKMASLTPEALHSMTDPFFTVEGSAPTVKIGESAAEVQTALGEPQKIIDLGSKKILIYKDLKVTLVDDKVTDAQ